MQDDTAPEDYADGDYGYDLAHEEMGEVHTAPAPKPEPPGSVPPPDDSGGDYGYDLAHDMRSS
jgi:hypothetical protein